MMSNVPLTREQVRLVDHIAIEEYGLPGIVLMENAGRGCAEFIGCLIRRLPGKPQPRVVILCGKGNNGGDGYVIARHLAISGIAVEVLSVVSIEELSGDAAIQAHIAQRCEIPIRTVTDEAEFQRTLFAASIIVDCLLGTGAQGAPRGAYATAIQVSNHASGLRIAVDIPSGLDCDSGEHSPPTFKADHTLTFVAAKVGFSHPMATAYLGEIEVISIGTPPAIVTRVLQPPS